MLAKNHTGEATVASALPMHNFMVRYIIIECNSFLKVSTIIILSS